MAIKDINRHWERVINTMNEALLIISEKGRILSVNRSFEEMTGYTANEVSGQPCTVLACQACEMAINSHGEGWCKLFEPDQPEMRRCRCTIKKKDGTFLPALKNASVLRDEDGTLLGAVETLTDLSEIDRLDRKVETLSRQLDDNSGFGGIIGNSEEMRAVFAIIEKAAISDAPIIIFGESGTGKELVARAIHDRGKRNDGPYVQLNCAALNESLLESELFGHVKGSFTGAFRDRTGRFESASGGDLFLDEIGDIPLSIQIKLLRVLETGQFERVGENISVSVDVRIITATNRNLLELIEQKRFREDLYFRINVIPIHLPPLRNRKDDIPLLVNTFIDRLEIRTGKPIRGLTREALNRFMAYRWPGNVREMKSALEYAFTVADKDTIDIDHLPPQMLTHTNPSASVPEAAFRETGSNERQQLIEALRAAAGNQSQAARMLGINRVTVWNRMRKYGINLKREIER
ncbi:sigma-54 interaction domain-containing protein [Desulfosarcina sp.]|uniref:sigma-54 interaction domain-containing protein n=1 Tax=Desulfosarcina sp. TaxID=2027861 RepID=UPI0029B9DF48|nr:sigma 54-interacting transcriptional regulator [Desulfosarcina sp.]MDX2452645.1 sigma 54-interacting transcriptional regulator [Desulfosarcina sp.]MDX2490423.1 sigma 54-interacting transcriptional regulator [Desulfosarcina sp.]